MPRHAKYLANVPTRQARYNNSALKARTANRRTSSKRIRGGQRNLHLPFAPPEDWHEPHGEGGNYRILVQDPGPGYRHILTPEDIRQRLAQVPAEFLQNLEVVQLSRMTRKKRSFPCYGMQWGSALYLYPLEETLVEHFGRAPQPSFVNETKMYGARWLADAPVAWRLVWSEASIRNFYLNNILIHELGHLVDDRNTSYVERERFAEWFAIEHGYRPASIAPARPRAKKVVRRHHSL